MTEKTLPVDYISSKDVSDILGIPRRTVSHYAREGKIPARRIPSGKYRYVRSEIEEFAERMGNDFNKKEVKEATN